MNEEKHDIEHVSDALAIASGLKLECEVVLWALKAMKNNPNLTIVEALDHGLGEWDL